MVKTKNRTRILKYTPLFFFVLVYFNFVPVAHAGIHLSDGRPALGMDLSPGDDWRPEQHFVDLVMQGRPWLDQNYSPIPQNTPLDSNGFPLQVPSGSITTFRLIMADASGGHYPSGNYTLIMKGTGHVTVQGDAGGSFSAPGTYTVPITAGGGVTINIDQSSVSDPIHELHLIMPGSNYTGYVSTNPAASLYSGFYQPIQGMSVIRMDEMSTNGSVVTTSTGILSPTNYTQGLEPAGSNLYMQVPAPEILAAMCNTVNADCWIHMPSLATDDFVTAFATRLHAALNPNLKVYIEYSNEIWNGIFPEYNWVAQKGSAMGLTCSSGWGTEGSICGYQVYRSVQIWQIFAGIFGQSRLVRVAACQFTNPSLCQLVAQGFATSSLKPAGNTQMPDALAVGAYFYSGDGGTTQATEANLLSNLQGGFTTAVKGDAAVAQQFGLRLVAYEAGQSLGGSAMDIATNRDQGMYSLYQTMFNIWYANGGELFMHYDYVGSFNASGCWGAQEYEGESTASAPKWRAILDQLASMTGGTPPPPPPANTCDLNNDGSVNSADVQSSVNQTLGAAPCTTANLQQTNPATCTAIDVQRVVNAVLGGTCVVGP